MASKLGVLVIHGMGSQEPGFSAPMVAEIQNRLGGVAERVVWKELFWADLLQEREEDLWRAMETATCDDGHDVPLSHHGLRKFILHSFGDAVAYQKDGSRHDNIYRLIHNRVSECVQSLISLLGEESAPVVVLAHSLGGHIISNYLWDRQHIPAGESDPQESIDNLLGLITMGCNMPLFSLAYSEAHPIQIPGSGITNHELIQNAAWLNYYDKNDVFGWPVLPMYAKNLSALTLGEMETYDRIRDFEINVGSIFSSWNPLSHEAYWTDNNFTTPVAKYLKEIISVLA